MMKTFKCIAAVLLMMSAISCSPKNGTRQLPSISGRAGELVVVTTKVQWEGDIGNAIREALGSDFGYLPQAEPKFDLMLVPKEGVNRLIKTHRNMLYVNVADTAKTGFSVRKDVWSAPQTMVIVSASDQESAVQCILENREQIADAFENAERSRNMAAAGAFEKGEITSKVCEAFGGSPSVPDGYSIKKQIPGFIWISNETSYTIQGIFIYSFPWDGEDLTAGKLIEKRDLILGRNVPATAEGSYMITNPSRTSGFRKVTYNGIERTEIRGLWDTYNDFMGGPFVAQAFKDKSGKNIIVAEGFVYAPKYDKRNYLRQVEGIVSTFRWIDPFQENAN